MLIRDFNERTDLRAVRELLVELQDFERRLNPRMPRGADIVKAYIPRMMSRCRTCRGKVLVAEVDGAIAGYATVLTRVQSDELEDGDFEYGLISDLVVTEKLRGMGLGKKLLEAAENYASDCKVETLRIGVLAGNEAAEDLYSSMGFSALYVEFEKDLTKP